MARTEAQRERSQYRKTQRMLETGHGGYHGKSILEKITDELDRATERYLDSKDDRVVTEKGLAIARGEIRGLARALHIFAVPIYSSIQQTEKASVRRVKEKRDAQAEAEANEQESRPGGDREGTGD